MEENLHLRRTGERGLPGQELVERAPQRILVRRGSNGCRCPRRLFRRHVGRRPHDNAVARQTLVPVFRIGPSGQAEVRQERFPLAIDHHVIGLDVAVHDPFAVGISHGFRQSLHDARGLERGHAAGFQFFERLAQGLSVDERRNQEVTAVIFTGLVERDNVGVPQVTRRPGFSKEALDLSRRTERARPGHLQRHFSVEVGVVAPVDFRERPFADAFAHFKPADPGGHVHRRCCRRQRV